MNDWSKHGHIEQGLRALSRLCLNRDFTAEELATFSGRLTRGELDVGDLITELLECPERGRLTENNCCYVPMLPALSMTEITSFMKAHKVGEALINIIICEYLFSRRLNISGVRLFRNTDEYGISFIENIRICRIASRCDFIDYVWLINRCIANMGWDLQARLIVTESIYHGCIVKPREMSAQNIVSSVDSDPLLSDVYLQAIFRECDVFTPVEILARIRNAMALRHVPDSMARKIGDIAKSIYDDRYLPEAPKENTVQFIFNSGIGFSGSSATYDLLRHSPECNEFPAPRDLPYIPGSAGSRESSLFHGNHNLDMLRLSLTQGRESFNRIAILGLLDCFFRFLIPVNDWEQYICAQSAVPAFFRNMTTLQAYLEAVRVFILNVKYAFFSLKPEFFFRMATGCLLSKMTRLMTGMERPFIIMDNSIFGWEAERLHCAPMNSIYLTTYRDPRDQYLSHRAALGFGTAQMIDRLHDARSSLLSAYHDLQESIRFIPVCYEKLILDAAYRQRLCDKIGLTRVEDKEHFDPSFSSTRIGKWHKYENQEEITLMASTFPDLVDKTFLGNFAENFMADNQIALQTK